VPSTGKIKTKMKRVVIVSLDAAARLYWTPIYWFDSLVIQFAWLMRGKISKQVNDGINQINQKTNCVLIRSQYELMCVIHRQVVAVSLFAQFV